MQKTAQSQCITLDKNWKVHHFISIVEKKNYKWKKPKNCFTGKKLTRDYHKIVCAEKENWWKNTNENDHIVKLYSEYAINKS